MKRHLVIVGGVVYPEPSPTGLCSMRYASLLDEDYDVEFIAISNNGKEEYVTYDGVPVHTLICKRLSIEYKTTGTLKKLIHLYGSSLLRTSIMGNLGWYSKAAYKELESIHNVRPIDVILTVCSPFSAHIAGAKFKKAHPEVRFNAYTVDPFATSNRIIPLFRKFGDLVTLLLPDKTCMEILCKKWRFHISCPKLMMQKVAFLMMSIFIVYMLAVSIGTFATQSIC